MYEAKQVHIWGYYMAQLSGLVSMLSSLLTIPITDHDFDHLPCFVGKAVVRMSTSSLCYATATRPDPFNPNHV